MMKAIVLLGLALGSTLSNGLHLPIQKVRVRGRPGSISMSKSGGNTSLTNLGTNLENSLYVAEFDVGGSSFTLALDTGSSDLWFVPGINEAAFAGSRIADPPLTLNFSYVTGSILGNVAQLDSLLFSGFKITNQSYLSVTKQDGFLQNAEERFLGSKELLG
ncbi:aspartyl protease [Ceratobasidium sp. AG-Ba]|nr:aspartyl protease [Ceratobasidium sp. AG-Ba]